jgi:hypothetical protein
MGGHDFLASHHATSSKVGYTGRLTIFKDGENKARFLEHLGQNLNKGKCAVYAWVLMDYHAHILRQVRVTTSSIARAVARMEQEGEALRYYGREKKRQLGTQRQRPQNSAETTTGLWIKIDLSGRINP